VRETAVFSPAETFPENIQDTQEIIIDSEEEEVEQEQVLNIKPTVLCEKPPTHNVCPAQLPQVFPQIVFGVYKENYDIFNLRSAENSPLKSEAQSPQQQSPRR